MRKLTFVATAVVVAMALAFASVTIAGDKSQSMAATGGAQVGAPAPQFSLADQTGKSVSLADQSGKIVVLEWFNEGCPIVQRHYQADTMNKLANKYQPQGVVWLAVNSTSGNTNDSNKKAADAWKMDRPILNDAEGTVGHLYGATNTPHMFIIDKDGKLAYAGAIDNDPNGKKADGKVNYVEKALDELLAGNSVSQPQTKAYGCGVHYAK